MLNNQEYKKKYLKYKKFKIGESIYDELLIDEKDIYKNIFVTNKNKKKCIVIDLKMINIKKIMKTV